MQDAGSKFMQAGLRTGRIQGLEFNWHKWDKGV